MAAQAMDDLADRYADRGVTSVFVYTREAHPAQNYREHTSMDVKRSHARALRDQCEVRRRILVDDLQGTAHQGYGVLPNMTWIAARGMLVYKAAWTVPADIEDALAASIEYLARRKAEGLTSVFSERLAWRGQDSAGFRAGLERNGPSAVTDFYGK